MKQLNRYEVRQKLRYFKLLIMTNNTKGRPEDVLLCCLFTKLKNFNILVLVQTLMLYRVWSHAPFVQYDEHSLQTCLVNHNL